MTTFTTLESFTGGADGGDPGYGALLMDAGVLDDDKVQRILDYQKKSDVLFGDAGVALGLLNEDDVRHEHIEGGLAERDE